MAHHRRRPPVLGTESVQGFDVTTVGPTINASRTPGAAAPTGPFNTFSITSGAQILRNGILDSITSAVTELYYSNHTLYQFGSGQWYQDTGTVNSYTGPVASPKPGSTLLGIAPTLFTNNSALGVNFQANIGTINTMTCYIDNGGGGTHWSGIAGYAGFIASQFTNPLSTSVIPLISLPMANTLDDATNAAAFSSINAGTYDSYITAMANVFKTAGFPILYVRPGWEMNLPTVTWLWGIGSASGAATGPTAALGTAFQNAFQRIYGLLHAVTGISVKVIWCPSSGWNIGTGTSSCYPGDAFVDVIAIDASDFYSNQNDRSPTSYTIGSAAAMAIAHGKPFAIDEFGITAGEPVTSWAPFMSSSQAIITGISGLTIDHLCYYVTDPAYGGDPVDTPAQAAAIKANFLACQAHST